MQLDANHRFVEVPILSPGVYMLSFKGDVIYVGKAKALYSRIYTHRTVYNTKQRGKRSPPWVTQPGIRFDQVHVLPCAVGDLDRLERETINRYQPKYNVQLRSNQITAPITLMVNGIALTMNAPKVYAERRV